MGTNYYLLEPTTCPCCGHLDPAGRRHIGKSSAGWCFLLHVYPDDAIRTLEDWQTRWRDKEIVDEYDHIITAAQMLDIITRRETERDWQKTPLGYRDWAEFHFYNYSAPGPQGLLRCDKTRSENGCIGCGEGTWDYIIGDFS